METPLTPLDFARRTRRLHGGREAVVDGDLRLSYEQFLGRCDRWSSALQDLGVGPGDPELLTLKAVRILRQADIVFVPTSALDRPSRAEQIVLAAAGVRSHRLVFALDDTGGTTSRRTAAWDEAGRAVVDSFAQGVRLAAF